MSKENRVEFYYLPEFYKSKSDNKISIFRNANDDEATIVDTALDMHMDGKTILIRPANKKELKRADQELLDLLRKG
jgi:hypothetical protein